MCSLTYEKFLTRKQSPHMTLGAKEGQISSNGVSGYYEFNIRVGVNSIPITSVIVKLRAVPCKYWLEPPSLLAGEPGYLHLYIPRESR